MKKNNTILMMFVSLLAASLFLSNSLLAAEVSRIQTNRGHIFINQGKADGFTIGTEACIYDHSGYEITCGSVIRTNPNYAVIKVNNRLAKQIKVGMQVHIGKPEIESQKQ